MSETTKEYKGFVGSIEVSLEDNCLHGKILFINDLVTYEGETVAEINKEFMQAVDRYLDYCERTGKEASKPCSGSFNIRVGPELHRLAMISAKVNHKSLNDFVREAMQNAIQQANKKAVCHNRVTGEK